VVVLVANIVMGPLDLIKKVIHYLKQTKPVLGADLGWFYAMAGEADFTVVQNFRIAKEPALIDTDSTHHPI